MVDVNLKVPALEKLMDYTASGIGAVAGPMLAPWKAGREAKAKLIEAKGQADRLTLIADAQAEARQYLIEPDGAVRETLEINASGITQRIEFQERKRQANISAVVLEAAAGLEDAEVLEHEPDPDWTARFFDCVQDVSSEDMQKLWAKVLSGEVRRPRATSLRTLDVLKNMSAQEAAMFQEVCSYVIEDFVFKHKEVEKNHSALSFGNLLLLENAGLMNLDATLLKSIDVSNGPHPHPSHLPRPGAGNIRYRRHFRGTSSRLPPDTGGQGTPSVRKMYIPIRLPQIVLTFPTQQEMRAVLHSNHREFPRREHCIHLRRILTHGVR